jgi:hypothetical protein
MAAEPGAAPAGAAPDDDRGGKDNGGGVMPGLAGGTIAGQPRGVGRMGSGNAVGHVVAGGATGLGVGVMERWGSVGRADGSGRAGALGALAALALQQAMTSESEMPATQASARRRR